MMMIKLMGTILAVTLVVAACSATETEQPPPVEQGNAADTAFAQGMIPHHGQAVEMSQLAVTQTTTPAILELAAAIEGAQGPEIDTMSEWLRQWGEEVPNPFGADHAHMDHGPDSGMLTAEQLEALSQAQGTDFDRLYLELMIAHHEGAVAMSVTVLSAGASPAVRDLAGQIIADQEAEMAMMRGMLADIP